MKTRYGFVSNSSSSSFVIHKMYLTPLQIYAIKNHIEVAPKLNEMGCGDNFYAYGSDRWDITDCGDTIRGYTSMDNFDMHEFMRRIGVCHYIEWSDY
jgi:hypothetical protein